MILNLKFILFSAMGGLIPAFIWLWFWLKEDEKHPEPKRLIARVFIAGGLGVFLAFILEKLTADVNASQFDGLQVDFGLGVENIKTVAEYVYLFFGWALIEEFVKYLAPLACIFHNREFDEPIDAMIYMITSAIGFAFVETSFFLFNSLYLTKDGLDYLMNGDLRFLGAMLLHIFSSALVGAVIALLFYSKKFTKGIWIALTILTAALLHALFNFFIIIDNGLHIINVLMTLWLLTIFIIILFEIIKHKYQNYVQR